MSSTLPESSNEEEQDNTQYLELKKMIPYELIERDITARSANLVIKRPEGLGSKTTIFEFRSSKQELQDVGKIQLSSVWHDEETPKRHREECKMRLLFEDGDEIFSLTPINYMCFDEETELLTKRGWLKFFEINMSDTVMTYNIDGDFMEWKPMIGFHVYQHDGKMLHMKHRSFDFLVTPNHKWVICNDRVKSKLYLEESSKLNSKHIIRRLAENVRLGDDNPLYEDNFISMKSMDVTEEDYKGFIWCPSTENKTVVVRRNGTVSISGNSYTYSDVWQQSNFTYRTKTVAKVLGLPQVEQVNTGKNIACIQAATDDNPTLTIDAIERLFSDITDPDELMIRRYAVFKQISGRLHKTYDPSICYIPFNKYFPDGIPLDWVHARGIDYHDSRIPWSVGWLSLNPRTDEAFLWQEFHPAIDGERAYNTYEIAKRIIRTSGDYQYILNLIDPLANAKQPNTLFSVTDDLNRICEQLRKTEGLGYPQWWQGWDTKGNTGRNEVGMRFKNSVRCGKPFNNRIKERGMNKNLPTLWICDSCPNFNKSLINWRYDEWVTSSSMAIHDQKATPSQKYSHDCMVLECLFKDARLTHASHFTRQNMASANR